MAQVGESGTSPLSGMETDGVGGGVVVPVAGSAKINVGGAVEGAGETDGVGGLNGPGGGILYLSLSGIEMDGILYSNMKIHNPELLVDYFLKR